MLASNRTMLAWIRTALSFAGIGFVVAKFGRVTGTDRVAAGYIGVFIVLLGLLLTITGFLLHRSVVIKERPPSGTPVVSEWPAVAAFVACAVSCALLAVYLSVTAF